MPFLTPFEALASLHPPTGRVVITVPDSTRSIDTITALQALVRWMGSSTQASVIVGLGLHRRSLKKELDTLKRACPWPVADHDPHACVTIGQLNGIPLSFPKDILNADHLISVGTVELHQYAGFSGGFKGLVIGCGGANQIHALHHRDFLSQPGILVGQIESNPFREHLERAGSLLPRATALQWVDQHGWIAGHPTNTLQLGADLLSPFYTVEDKADLAILSVPESKAQNVYQASRAATYLALSPNPPLKKGALIVVEAECPEGIGLGPGEQNCAEALSSCTPPWTELLSGEFPYGGGAQRAVMLARLCQDYRLEFTGCLTADSVRQLGLEATTQSALERYGTQGLRIESPFLSLPQLAQP